jgi:hypothetical protein
MLNGNVQSHTHKNSDEEFKLQERFALYMWEFPEYSYIQNSTEGRRTIDLITVDVTCSWKHGHLPGCGKSCIYPFWILKRKAMPEKRRNIYLLTSVIKIKFKLLLYSEYFRMFSKNILKLLKRKEFYLLRYNTV